MGTNLNAAERPKPSWLLVANTMIVLALTAGLLAACATVLLVPMASSPFALLGAICFTPPVLAFGIVVYLSVFRRSRWATEAATACYFLGECFVAFGVVANVGEACLGPDPPSMGVLFVIAVAGLGVAGYFAFSAWISSKWAARLRTSALSPPASPPG